MDDISVLNLFIEAGLVVKLVMIILLIASLLTWIVIFERYNFFRDLKKTNSDFLKTFWSGGDLNKLYAKTENSKNVEFGVTNVFKMLLKNLIN
jgi:biopolymer transport protein TolQ